MNKLTLEYEDKGKQYVLTTNFKICDIKTEVDRIEVFGGKNNAKNYEIITNKSFILKLDGVNNMLITYPTNEEELEIDYVVVPEKPKKKKRKKRKKKKKNLDNKNK